MPTSLAGVGVSGSAKKRCTSHECCWGLGRGGIACRSFGEASSRHQCVVLCGTLHVRNVGLKHVAKGVHMNVYVAASLSWLPALIPCWARRN